MVTAPEKTTKKNDEKEKKKQHSHLRMYLMNLANR
jgi:hypothetical protein